jgi:hypothetical protein
MSPDSRQQFEIPTTFGAVPLKSYAEILKQGLAEPLPEAFKSSSPAKSPYSELLDSRVIFCRGRTD